MEKYFNRNYFSIFNCRNVQRIQSHVKLYNYSLLFVDAAEVETYVDWEEKC